MTVNSDIKRNKRKTIGFIINQLHDRYQTMICPGIMDGAKKRNYNLIAFVGKALNSPSAFENQENVVYKLANEKNIDGLLILSGAIGNYLSMEELKNFCNKYKSIPTVCVSTPLKGIPSIWVDNHIGMYDIVTHFVKIHQYKRIAFVRGPSNNPEAELRYKIFKEVLSKNNVPIISELIYEGDFVWFSGVNAIKTIIDERKAKFDAILAANDEMLVGVYRELIRRGIKIPDEVAIGGFDNIDETRIITPQITTVMQPLYEEGLKALELLADKIEGKQIKDLYTFPSQLIIRQSCGCKSINNLDEIKKNPICLSKNEKNIKLTKTQKNIILKQLLNDVEIRYNSSKEYLKYECFIEIYLKYFLEEIEKDNNKFINQVYKLTESSQEGNVDLEFFKTLISKIYLNIYPYLNYSSELNYKAFNLYNSASLMLLDSISRYNQNMMIKSRDYNWSMLNVTKILSTTFNLENLRNVINKLLPTLNISYCFIALYENNTESLTFPTTQSSVFLNFKAENNYEYNYKKKFIFDTNLLIPDKLLNKNKIFNLVIFPLVTENDHFGYIAFDYNSIRDPIMYETLQGHISASLKGAILLETVTKQSFDLFNQKDELSKSLEKLRKVMGGFINSMSLLIETRDPYTAGHQARVANLARAMATELGLPKEQIEGIRISGVLHDLGKFYIPSQILNKPGRLMDEELSLIKIHPQIGYNILKSVDFPWPIADIILQHHERIDGSGYPYGLKSNQIMIEAQIICVADVVEAISSHRPYRPALGIDVALDEISKNKGKFYDPVLVDCCIKLFKEKGFDFGDFSNTFQYPLSK